tara:strand:- start:1990 stop:2421 length:432 start_codon:yes stop_codon:yes gene_type:complete
MVMEFKTSDFIGIKQLLNSSVEEDISVGLSNIDNLNLDPIYVLLLAKMAPKNTREKILEKNKDILELELFSEYKVTLDRRWGSPIQAVDLSWDKLYNTISSHYTNDLEAKKIFKSQFDNEWVSTIREVVKFPWIDDIKLDITW